MHTTLGEMPEELLLLTEGFEEDERARVEWKEYRYEGEIVRRDVHVTAKQGLSSIGQTATI